MKGIHGLGLAIALGIAGALLNLAYLNNKAKDVAKVEFIGIAAGTTIRPGERLTQKDLVPVGIPERWVGKLRDFAVPFSARNTVVGEPVWRAIEGGTLLLNEDLKTPPPELELAADERAWGIPVDSRQFVPSLIVPGDLVSFLASAVPSGSPTPATVEPFSGDDALAPEPGGQADSTRSPAPADIIGPFKVLALGNRLGSAEVMRTAGLRQVQENVMLIRVTVQADGSLDPKSQKLRDLLDASGGRPLSILLHPRSS
ncbi:MAG: hypothetical protein JXB62_03220 [Pirellulales bacterium]|nr:hypothetical protein [Pirellulales bacterium]